MTTKSHGRNFKTSNGRLIPPDVMSEIERRLLADDDWQNVATDLLTDLIPEGDDDLEEVNEVLREAEKRAGIAQ